MSYAETIGVDTGGTFTDFVCVAEDGTLHVYKQPSTPANPSQSVVDGIRHLKKTGFLSGGFNLVHGTTVGTNALLQRRTAKTALITTRGFADVLEIARQNRAKLYALLPEKEEPLLSHQYRFEVSERLDFEGKVLIQLDRNEVKTLLDFLKVQGVESVAVCLLFGYLNAEHEQTIALEARRRGFFVSLAAEIAPEPREYERTCTVVANACIVPIMSRYLEELDKETSALGAKILRVMQSNGGALSAKSAGDHAIKTALSGPAGGVIAAERLGQETGIRNLMTFDMGGTSADVALLLEGKPQMMTNGKIGTLPLATPMLDIHTIGAGGGSIAWLDSAGGLRVGPQSAGADPGPVAYGKGEALTVTDANLLLNRIPASVRLAGTVRLDKERVEQRFAEFSAKLSCTSEETALAILHITEMAMARALRYISVERGHDPARFALVAFGGAGGLHACKLAEMLGMRTVLFPRFPGAFSALGLAAAPLQFEGVYPLPPTLFDNNPALQNLLEEAKTTLEREAEARLATEGILTLSGEADWRGELTLDLRFVGQSFHLRVPYDSAGIEATKDRFARQHHQRYGHADTTQKIEAVGMRLSVALQTHETIGRAAMPTSEGKPISTVLLIEKEESLSASIYLRESLAEGQELSVPCLILQSDATTYLKRGWSAVVDSFGNLHATHHP